MGMKLALVSGDCQSAVYSVARELGICPKSVAAESTPESKSQFIQKRPRALMVGDGANDALALSAAFVSLSVQGGMEVSMRAADIYSSQPGVSVVPNLIIVARETMRVIRRNLGFAVLYNVVVVSIALAGLLNPLIAAILMPISAFTVFGLSVSGTRELKRALQEIGA
jgi:Cu2+-exporting ATPase/Cu+-exporting ATPase